MACIYINPLKTLLEQFMVAPAVLVTLPRHSACVDFWMRPACAAEGNDLKLLQTLCSWFAQEWAFEQIVFPVTHREHRQIQLFQEAELALLATGPTRYSTLYVYG